MKTLTLLTLLILCFNNLNAQELTAWEALGYKKVTINKNLVAYAISYSYKKNGFESGTKSNNPSFNNPYNISIRSNKNGGRVLIKNKNKLEDLVFEFESIVRGDTPWGGKHYSFNMKNDNYSVDYYEENKDNSMMLITIEEDSNNSVSMSYTISKL